MVFTKVVPAGSPDVVVPASGIHIQFYYVASFKLVKYLVACFILSVHVGELIPGMLKKR